MARSISEIKAHIAQTFIEQEAIRSGYGLQDGVTFDKAFSPVSIESIMFYVVASCIWLLETLFDRHMDEIDTKIESLRPHTLRWYVAKTLEYMHGKNLRMEDGVVVADYYDTSRMTDEEINKARVVKYAVATEGENSEVYIKVAAQDENGQPTKLSVEHENGLKYYLSQIKDAGVAIKVLNNPADEMRMELLIIYDPAILTATTSGVADNDGYTRLLMLTHDGKTDVISQTVSSVISRLPFNGEYRNSDLMAALQAIEGVKVADIVKVEAAVGTSGNFSPVVGFRRPESGYYKIATENLIVRGRAYNYSDQ